MKWGSCEQNCNRVGNLSPRSVSLAIGEQCLAMLLGIFCQSSPSSTARIGGPKMFAVRYFCHLKVEVVDF